MVSSKCDQLRVAGQDEALYGPTSMVGPDGFDGER